MTDAIDLVWKSFKDFKNNLIVLAPMLVQTVLFIGLAIFVALQVGLGYLIFGSTEFSPGLLAYIIPLAIIDYILIFLITIYTMGAQAGIIMDVVVHGKSSFNRMLRHGRTFLMPLLTYTLATIVVTLLPLIIIILIIWTSFLATPVPGIILGIILGLVYLFFVIAISVLSIFGMPIVLSKKLYGFNAFIEVIKYSKANLRHTFITLALVILLWFVFSFIYVVFLIPAMIGEIALQASLLDNIPLYFVGTFVMRLPASIVLWISGIVMSFFVFNSYFDKNPIKNWK